ncbi:hypothetical protein [Nocardiopsis ansamitocini]|uniref:Uncharacterized protein n=1 Tax=Nocardiopsis ansamitocini TaxID=1670832 RepID=A0A9W6PA66_9ACTN|nr:hypothetical protein [Nocardiopsis ansamitocini]GLU49946.1 hypothetical protein Nans01_42970 [Nocardiopsis ansamitocini]
MIPTADVVGRTGGDGAMPLLTLDAFFAGDDDEEYIAPNRWGHGRPPSAVPAERFRAIERCADVAWVRVQPHPETLARGELAGEAVAVCTARTGGVEPDGVVRGLVDDYRDVPRVPDGATVWSVVWD